MLEILTPEQEARNFDKVRDKRSDDKKPLTREQKQVIKERAERSRAFAENTKRESLKPFVEFEKDPLGTIKYLCEQGDFQGSYQKRMELFNLMTMVQILNSLKELVNLLSKKK